MERVTDLLFMWRRALVPVAAGILVAIPLAAGVMAQSPGPARADTLAGAGRAATPPIDPAPIAADPDSALQWTLQSIAGEPIALQEALAAALAHATDLRTARAQLGAARGSLRSERGEFLPELFGRAERLVDDSPTASFFAGADVLNTEQDRLEAGARWRLPIGTELSASLNATRLETNSAFATLSPQHDAFGRLEVVQPLLKGFGKGARSDLTAAEREVEAASAGFEDARLATAAEVERTYWALFAAERDHAVQLLIRDQAEAFLREAHVRADAGLASPGAVANARVFLVQQSQTAMDTEERLDRLSDDLAILTGRTPEGPAGRFHPVDPPPADAPAAPPETVVELALARSPQVAFAERTVAAARALAAGARRNALPQLDLFGTYGGRGLAGTGREVILDFGGGGPDTLGSDLDTDFGESLSQVFSRDYPAWSAGVVFSYPFGGRDRGERDRLAARAVVQEQQLEAVRRDLAAAVRSDLRELERGRARLDLAAQGVEASLEQVRIGRLEFRSGRTTVFELVRLGADLADAQRRYSAALVRTAEAIASLRRLTGGAYPTLPPLPDPDEPDPSEETTP